MIKEVRCITTDTVARSPTGDPGHNVSDDRAEDHRNATCWNSNNDRQTLSRKAEVNAQIGNQQKDGG